MHTALDACILGPALPLGNMENFLEAIEVSWKEAAKS